MENEQVDPLYEYIDKEIELVKEEIRQLKVSNDTVAKEHGEALTKIATAYGWIESEQ